MKQLFDQGPKGGRVRIKQIAEGKQVIRRGNSGSGEDWKVYEQHRVQCGWRRVE